tara:strand:- start:327 stop:839 length:513 start_codon:yes stop_codon:yes gene_type:complete
MTVSLSASRRSGKCTEIRPRYMRACSTRLNTFFGMTRKVALIRPRLLILIKRFITWSLRRAFTHKSKKKSFEQQPACLADLPAEESVLLLSAVGKSGRFFAMNKNAQEFSKDFLILWFPEDRQIRLYHIGKSGKATDRKLLQIFPAPDGPNDSRLNDMIANWLIYFQFET